MSRMSEALSCTSGTGCFTKVTQVGKGKRRRKASARRHRRLKNGNGSLGSRLVEEGDPVLAERAVVAE